MPPSVFNNLRGESSRLCNSLSRPQRTQSSLHLFGEKLLSYNYAAQLLKTRQCGYLLALCPTPPLALRGYPC